MIAKLIDLHEKNHRMLIKEFANKNIPVLKPEDTGNYALSMMEDLKLQHLPVADEGKYLFLLTDKDIFQMEHIEAAIHNRSVFSPYIKENSHLIDALHIFSRHKLSVLPVVDDEGNYLACLTSSKLIEKMDEMCNAGSVGSIVAIEINPLDYDLSNIARLAESNNIKIQTLFTYPVSQTEKLTMLLKIDTEDASPFLRSLERFGYNVIYYSHKDGLIDEVLMKRLDELMYYLKI
jgi:CBS domain-containing protein